jgi:hypothetical protein
MLRAGGAGDKLGPAAPEVTKSQQAEKDKPEIAKIGSKSEVVISGRRLLCKILRAVSRFRVGGADMLRAGGAGDKLGPAAPEDPAERKTVPALSASP